MIKKMLCENDHVLFIEWETGTVYEKTCVNIATNYTVDKYGIFYLCKECYDEGCKRRIDSKNLTLRGVYNNER